MRRRDDDEEEAEEEEEEEAEEREGEGGETVFNSVRCAPHAGTSRPTENNDQVIGMARKRASMQRAGPSIHVCIGECVLCLGAWRRGGGKGGGLHAYMSL
eukprot:3845255-Pyramimonas_sp.AAC.1